MIYFKSVDTINGDSYWLNVTSTLFLIWYLIKRYFLIKYQDQVITKD